VVVTTHLYDGKKSLPLDIELYQQAQSLAEGKKDPEFKKKPEIALNLINRSLSTHLPHPKVSQLIRARMIINRGAITVLMFELSQNLGRERFRGKRDYCVS